VGVGAARMKTDVIQANKPPSLVEWDCEALRGERGKE
jgi:hypothetical protein